MFRMVELKIFRVPHFPTSGNILIVLVLVITQSNWKSGYCIILCIPKSIACYHYMSTDITSLQHNLLDMNQILGAVKRRERISCDICNYEI
jgi:hypothetical protein